MEQPNYFHEAEKQLNKMVKKYFDSESTIEYQYFEHIDVSLGAMKEAKKFILPKGGIYVDKLEAAEAMDLRLPYESIILEYELVLSDIKDLDKPNIHIFSKKIVFALQSPEDNSIALQSIYYNDKNNTWTFIPLIVRITDEKTTIVDGLHTVAVNVVALNSEFDKSKMTKFFDLTLSTDVSVLLSFIYALDCKNVVDKALPIRKRSKVATLNKALPYNEYRVLTIKTTAKPKEIKEARIPFDECRSVRRHTRRGHARTYKTGVKIWISSMIVGGSQDHYVDGVYRII